jgi:inhibitor of cysteine peptidase
LREARPIMAIARKEIRVIPGQAERMRVTIATLSLLAIAACAPAAPSGAATRAEGLTAPIPDHIGIRITESQNNQIVVVPVGQAFAVALVGIPTAGYVWQATETPPFVERTGEAGGATHRDQLQPGFTGGSHWEVQFFRATRVGRGALKLEQRRPWEKDTPPTQTFSVTIDAQ